MPTDWVLHHIAKEDWVLFHFAKVSPTIGDQQAHWIEDNSKKNLWSSAKPNIRSCLIQILLAPIKHEIAALIMKLSKQNFNGCKLFLKLIITDRIKLLEERIAAKAPIIGINSAY